MDTNQCVESGPYIHSLSNWILRDWTFSCACSLFHVQGCYICTCRPRHTAQCLICCCSVSSRNESWRRHISAIPLGLYISLPWVVNAVAGSGSCRIIYILFCRHARITSIATNDLHNGIHHSTDIYSYVGKSHVWA